MIGAAIASLGMGNGFTLLYSYIIDQYSKEKEMTISTVSSLSVVPGAALAMISPFLIDHGHFHTSLLFALGLIGALIVSSLPVLKDSIVLEKIKTALGLNNETTSTETPKEEGPKVDTEKKKPFEDLGKWWHTPKNGPDMNNPTPQN